jgi:hypothetical protein
MVLQEPNMPTKPSWYWAIFGVKKNDALMLVLFPGSISFFLFGAFLVCSIMKCSMGMS